MARYTVLDQADIKKIAEYFEIEVLSFKAMEGGAANSSYLVTTPKNRLILTVYDDKSYKHVIRLAKILQHLYANNFVTTQIIAPKNNSIVMKFGKKPVILKRYVSGVVRSDLSEQMLFQIGDNIANLHKVPVPNFIDDQHPYGKEKVSSIRSNKIHPEYEQWLFQNYQRLGELIPADLPKAMIHGDLFYDNVLFEDNKLVAIIDFEEACKYYRVFDLGMAIVGMCIKAGQPNFVNASALLRGYQNSLSLEIIEKEKLQLFIEYAAMSTSYWRYWKYNIHNPNSSKAEKYNEMVAIAKFVSSIDPEEFINALF